MFRGTHETLHKMNIVRSPFINLHLFILLSILKQKHFESGMMFDKHVTYILNSIFSLYVTLLFDIDGAAKDGTSTAVYQRQVLWHGYNPACELLHSQVWHDESF